MSKAENSRGQHHKKLAWITAGALAMALVVGIGSVPMPQGETLWHLIAAPEEDGTWRFLSIDGQDVSRSGYTVGIRWGEITGFHDGCNSCGFDDDTPAGSAQRMLTCTLVACEPRRHDPLFNRFAHGSPRMRATGDRLVLTLPGHRAELARARLAQVRR